MPVAGVGLFDLPKATSNSVSGTQLQLQHCRLDTKLTRDRVTGSCLQLGSPSPGHAVPGGWGSTRRLPGVSTLPNPPAGQHSITLICNHNAEQGVWPAAHDQKAVALTTWWAVSRPKERQLSWVTPQRSTTNNALTELLQPFSGRRQHIKWSALEHPHEHAYSTSPSRGRAPVEDSSESQAHLSTSLSTSPELIQMLMKRLLLSKNRNTTSLGQ